jgi:hypothetical protein
LEREPASKRFWAVVILASTSAGTAVLSLLWHDWIEVVLGFDPDAHSGLVEVLVPVVLGLVALILGRCARAEWRRRTPLIAE